jgi:serine/threonine protein kinase/tetratricopeptide (TPR) repeat protein
MSSAHPLPATARDLARQIIDEWARTGRAPDAPAALAEHPELGDDPSAFLDLALEEYFRRREDGEAVDADEFCARFPGRRSFLRQVLRADEMLVHCPSALDDHEPLAPEPASWPLPGEALGRFKLRRELGRGAFARVYLATEAMAGDRPVAVKLSRAPGEARVQARLHHGNIVPVLWGDQEPETGLYLLCMPYLGSATLTHVLDRAFPTAGAAPPRSAAVIREAIDGCAKPGDPAPDQQLAGPPLEGLSYPEAVAALGAELADALALIHHGDRAHCDLKPSNVLLTPGGRPLLLDFNLSRDARRERGRFGGTFAYMAPEAIQAWIDRRPLLPADAARADLFSLGAVLFELLSGRLPGGALPPGAPAEQADGALRNLRLPRPALRECNGDVPDWLAGVIEACLEWGPARRPADAKAAAAALRREDQAPQPLRRRLMAGLAGAGALACGVMLAAALSRDSTPSADDSTPSPEPPVVPAAPTLRAKPDGRDWLATAWAELNRGRRAEADKALGAAEEAFREAIEKHKRQTGVKHGRWEDYFGLGRALMLRGELEDAQRFLGIAREVRAEQVARGAGEEPRLLACRAYCQAAGAQHEAAIHLYELAMKAGLRTAAVRNNLAYSYFKSEKHPEKAEQLLQEALDMQRPELRQALRNRAAMAFAKHQRGAQPLPLWVVADLDRVVKMGALPGQEEPSSLYLLAARAHARALADEQKRAVYGFDKAERQRLWNRTLELVWRACELGALHEPILRDEDLTSALGWLIAENLPIALQEAVPGLSTYLADPLGAPLD